MKNQQNAGHDEFLRKLEEHKGQLHRLCRVYAEDDDDRRDLWQQAIFQIWKSYRSFRGEAEFSTWMYRVALNTALMHHRSRRRRPETVALDQADLILAQPQNHYDDRDVHRLHQAIHQLPPIDRAIILLKLEERSYQEIAEIVGLTASAISVRLVRITGKLRDLMNASGHIQEDRP